MEIVWESREHDEMTSLLEMPEVFSHMETMVEKTDPRACVAGHHVRERKS